MSRLDSIFGGLKDKPGADYMRTLFDRYRALMSEGDVDGIVALFAPDARWEEPVGSTPAIGHDAIRTRYKAALEGSGGRIPLKADGAVRIAGNRALACSIGEVSPNGYPMIVESANAVTCDEEGLITEMLVYVGPTNFKRVEE